jgi:hypothetical protein
MKKIIRLSYRKIIDASAVQPWDQLVFESAYAEFLMQSQFYNQEKKYTSFQQLLQHVSGAERLHGLVSTAVVGYLKQLEGKLPDIADNLGKRFLTFKQFQFEIIDADTKDKARFKIAIQFFTDAYYWLDTISPYLLLTPVTAATTADGMLTHLLQLQPFLSIYSLNEEQND